MQVAFIVDEAFPIYKIGGLGDVGGSLPKALSKIGVDISIILPRHPEIKLTNEWREADTFKIFYGDQDYQVRVFAGKLPDTDIDVFLIDEPNFISEHSDASDNHADKFAIFSLAVARWLSMIADTDKPKIIHLNDWHTALVPIILKHIYRLEQFKYVISIHNLMYQGITNTPVSWKLGLKTGVCQFVDMDMHDHHLNILLEGLLHSDVISTVSPTYAKEILTSKYGEKIDEILSIRKKDIIGILNGLDLKSFNPANDPMIDHQFSSENAIEMKTKNKYALQSETGLRQGESMMIGYVGRVDPSQKGIQLIIEAIVDGSFPPTNCQFIFLGTGDPKLEQQLHEVAKDKPNIKIFTRFDEPLARKIYASSDLLLIPSAFEPCGLIQMIANRYGGIPVARATGGLIDTIADGVNGFLFADYTKDAMMAALKRAIVRIADPSTKASLVAHAMQKDFSWDKSAIEYKQVYDSLC